MLPWSHFHPGAAASADPSSKLCTAGQNYWGNTHLLLSQCNIIQCQKYAYPKLTQAVVILAVDPVPRAVRHK